MSNGEDIKATRIFGAFFLIGLLVFTNSPVFSQSTSGDSDVPKKPTLFVTTPGGKAIAIEGRVIGGVKAPSDAFPWVVSIGVAGASSLNGHFCGGSLIASNWVLTAAHCLKDISSASEIVIKAGSSELDSGGQIIAAEKFISHPEFRATSWENDIALIKLARPVENPVPINLLAEGESRALLFDGVLAVVAGWGVTSENSSKASNDLREVAVQIVSDVVCSQPDSYPDRIKRGMFCAGQPEGGKDSCSGDSGGPLMISDHKGGYLLAGIVSWGEGCARPKKWGVYTKAGNFLPWINGALK